MYLLIKVCLCSQVEQQQEFETTLLLCLKNALNGCIDFYSAKYSYVSLKKKLNEIVRLLQYGGDLKYGLFQPYDLNDNVFVYKSSQDLMIRI